MKALVVTTDHELVLREMAVPEPGPCEALVRILACGVCSSTDRKIIKGTLPYVTDYPCVLGHESVGEVVAVGAKVTAFKPGDWVKRPYAVFPGEERDGLHSGWGGFAEYGLVVDGRALEGQGGPAHESNYMAVRQHAVPRRADVGEAVLAGPIAEVKSWFDCIGPVAGKRVAVAGTGIAGYTAVICAKEAGAGRIVVLDRRQHRNDLGRELGADMGVTVAEGDLVRRMQDAAGGDVDVFCECVGEQSLLEVGLEALAPDGLMAIYGVPNEPYMLPVGVLGAPKRIAVFPPQEHLAYDWAIDAIERGVAPGDKLLTHRMELDGFEELFDRIAAGDVVKGMLEMTPRQ